MAQATSLSLLPDPDSAEMFTAARLREICLHEVMLHVALVEAAYRSVPMAKRAARVRAARRHHPSAS